MIEFLPLGGADEIGASCFYLNIAGTGILLDCGIHPRKTGFESLPDFSLIENKPVDFIFISHAHQDHIGGLPFLIKKFPHIQIYSTKQTAELALLTLHNAVDLIKNSIDEPGFEVYTHDEVEMLVKSIRFLKYEETLSLEGMRHTSKNKIKFTLYDAGHILGSASVLIEFVNEKIFYTGDIRLESQFILNGASIPDFRITALMTETTYGSTDSKSLGTFSSEAERFTKAANKILNSGGSVLIPVFALGKMQEIILMLHNLKSKNKLLHVPVYSGGLSRKISGVYDDNRYLVRRNNNEIKLGDIEQENYFEINDISFFSKNPSIVLATSGMVLPQTTSFRFADYWLNDNKSAIFIVGYCDPDTPGFTLTNSKQNDKIIFNSFLREVKCSIQRFYFPAHSNRENLLKIFNRLSPKQVILIHGEEKSQQWLGGKILTHKPETKVHAAQKGKTVLIQNNLDC